MKMIRRERANSWRLEREVLSGGELGGLEWVGWLVILSLSLWFGFPL